jgi:lipopolysaccharide heptosyltransferase II
MMAQNKPDELRKDAWHRARRILCVRLDALGDVIMTGPALRAVKESAPHRQVSLLTSASGAEAGRLMPFLEEVLLYEAPWMKAGDARDSAALDRRLIAQLRAARFDAAIIFTVYSQNPLPAALLCYLADIPLRLGHCRENPYKLLTDWIREPEPDTCIRHEVRRQLDLVQWIGAHAEDERLTLAIPPASHEAIDSLLASTVRSGTDRFVVIHAGASAASRRYPPEQFAVVARRVAEDFGCGILFTGTSSERDLVETIRAAAGVPSYSLVGQLDLASLAALLARAQLLISNNTGTVHVAAAVGTPVVDLYALTNPQHTPWLVPHRVLSHDVPCKFCYRSICPEGHHDCLRLITPDQIMSAAAELPTLGLLSDRRGGSHCVYARD